MLFKSKDLKGYALNTLDGEIGKVKAFYFDDHHWAVRYMVVDTGTWLKERQVLISPYSLAGLDNEHRTIHVNLTNRQIDGSPSLNTDKPVSLQFEDDFYKYYGWPTYWGGEYMWGAFPNLVRDSTPKPSPNEGGKAWDPHLQSTVAVNAFSIEAMDGDIGYVDDFLIDDESWAIRYLIVQTREWWPGKKILVSPKWIDHVSWPESKVFLNLLRVSIRNSPEYTETEALTREYENSLHHHYSKAGYWEKYDPDVLK